MTETKICKDCKQEKTIDKFIKADGQHRKPRNRCKDCTNFHSKIRSKLRKKFNPPDSGRCRICKVETSKWVLDHCHRTKTFRGYICKDCNSGIGLLRDSVRVIFKCMIYLLLHKLKSKSKYGVDK